MWKLQKNSRRREGLHRLPAPPLIIPEGGPGIRTQDQNQDVAREVCQKVAKRMRELPSYNEATTEEDCTSDEEDQQVYMKKTRGSKVRYAPYRGNFRGEEGYLAT